MISTRAETLAKMSGQVPACRFEHGTGHGADCGACKARNLAFCSVLDHSELHEIESIVQHLNLHAEGELFMEGDAANHVFNVTSGTVRLYKLLADGRRQIVGFLLPGDFLGLSMRRTYAYGAEAVDDATLCRFRTDELRALFSKYPKLERRLLEMTGDELAAAQDQMMLLGRKSPVEKLGSFLLYMSARQGRWGRAANPVRLPMTRGDIADYLGLTIETVSRTFTRLRKEGVIELPEVQTVEIRDEEGLRALAEGA
jgi:CRP/FNR family transcriptional regulator